MFGRFYVLGSSLVALWAENVHGAAYITRDSIEASRIASSTLFTKRDEIHNASDIFAPLSTNYPVTEDGRCGRSFGTRCEPDECCSSEGWCGNGYLYCSAPACQYEYGPRCDANRQPQGAYTEDWPRDHVGSVPYGEGIFHCSIPGTVALTFDDGPWEYTEALLNILQDYGAKATFFITGRNLGKGAINDPSTDWPRLIRRMKADGHQIGSHTWSHQRLPGIGKSRVRQQMIYNEIAIADLIGVFPTYMRPPYSASDDDIDRWLGELGYHITYFDLDTEGYLHEDANEISEDIIQKAFDEKDAEYDSILHIEHDTVSESVYNLVPFTLDLLYRAGFRPVTVGECLGDPEKNCAEAHQDPVTAEATSQASYVPVPKKVHIPKKLSLDVKNPLRPLEKFRSAQPMHRRLYGGDPPNFPSNGSFANVNASVPLRYPIPTIDGRCGPDHGNTTCLNQKIENCCSKAGWCGATEGHCLDGCQEWFGRCGMFGHS
ncbi:carbohydrate-binding module family 18 [Trichoderma chlorosporum]